MICNSLPHIYPYITYHIYIYMYIHISYMYIYPYIIYSHLQWVSMASCNIFFDHQNGIRHWKNQKKSQAHAFVLHDGIKGRLPSFLRAPRPFRASATPLTALCDRGAEGQGAAGALAAALAVKSVGRAELGEFQWENHGKSWKIMENHGKSTSSSGNGEMIETSEVPRTQKKKLISKWKTYQTKWC